MKWNPFNTRIGLALGGGAARGIAHIGVLKALEEEGIDIACIAGTSSGALVASYYAFGQPVDQIMSIGATLNLTKIINFTISKRGLFSTDAIRAMVLRDLGDCRIEDALIPLAICATDITTGEQVVFREGSLADAVCASMSVPGLFVPVEVAGRTLVDGGIVENVPVSPLEVMGAGIIVAVDLSCASHYPEPADTLEVVGNAIDIAMGLRTREQLKQADVVVALELSQYSRTNNTDVADALFMEGYRPMKSKMAELRTFKHIDVIRYLAKVVGELVPFKVPELVRGGLQKLRSSAGQ